MDMLGTVRWKTSVAVAAGVFVLSLPCVLFDGVLQWEDFAVSQLWLPVGAMCQGFFVVNGTYGWGWEKFSAAVSAGRGWSMPKWMRWHMAFVVPALMLIVLAAGLVRLAIG